MRHDPSREKLARLLHEVAHASHMIPSTHYLPVADLSFNNCILEADCGEDYTYRARWREQNIAIRVMKYASDEEHQNVCHKIYTYVPFPNPSGKTDHHNIPISFRFSFARSFYLKHDNILFYEGVLHPGEVPKYFLVAHRDMPWIVSKWQPRGNILNYIRDTQPTPLQIIDLVSDTTYKMILLIW
jgi:hypothetical protein